MGFVGLVGMFFYYRRRSRSAVGPALSLLGAAVMAWAVVYLWLRGHS